MVSAVDQNISSLKYFEVDYNLEITSTEWINQIKPGDLVILIGYFGFPIPPDIARKVKEKGAYLLEDACQALLSDHVGTFSDFVLFSPRKFVGVPDGGILVSCGNVEIENVELETIPPAISLQDS